MFSGLDMNLPFCRPVGFDRYAGEEESVFVHIHHASIIAPREDAVKRKGFCNFCLFCGILSPRLPIYGTCCTASPEAVQ
jgi:hypothetical protein